MNRCPAGTFTDDKICVTGTSRAHKRASERKYDKFADRTGARRAAGAIDILPGAEDELLEFD